MEMVTIMKRAKREMKPGGESVLRDFIRFSRSATVGLTTVAEAEGRKIVRQMTEWGQITPEQEDYLLNQLLNRMKLSRQVFETRVEDSVRKAVDKIGEISATELAKLTEHIAQLEYRIEALQKKRNN